MKEVGGTVVPGQELGLWGIGALFSWRLSSGTGFEKEAEVVGVFKMLGLEV